MNQAGQTESLRFAGRAVRHLLAPALIGIATGAAVAAMVGAVEKWGLRELGSLPSYWPAVFAPVGLLLTWLIGRWLVGRPSTATSELYIALYHQADGSLPVEQVPARVLATTATVGLGGSQGFESTSALVGAACGEMLGRCRSGVSADAKRTLWACGASAGIAAVFSSPAAGALYGIEVPFKREIDLPKLIPCVVSAVASFATRCWLIGEQRLITISGTPTLDGWFLLGCLLVAILCGLGARLFAAIERGIRWVGQHQSRASRALVGGLALTGVAIAAFEVCGRWITFGSGYAATGWLEARPWPLGLLFLALLLRAGGNLLTVYGGGGGGVFTSLAANGALVGEMVAVALDCDRTHTLALFGAACFLGAGYRLPVACMFFVAEAALGPLATGVGLAGVAIAFLIMGDDSVSEAQSDDRP